jgi:hypothetical protein
MISNKQNDGLAMGAPMSAILAEVFIQYLEQTKVIEILKEHHIVNCFRYVAGILIVYNTQITNIDDTLTDFNTVHPQIEFTIKKERQHTNLFRSNHTQKFMPSI